MRKFYKIENGYPQTYEERDPNATALEGFKEFTVYSDGRYSEPELQEAMDKQKEVQELEKWKESRQAAVDTLEVVHNGVVYQAGETDRARMASAIAGLLDGDVQKWRAKDNSEQFLTKEDLRTILKMGNDKQTELWFPSQT